MHRLRVQLDIAQLTQAFEMLIVAEVTEADGCRAIPELLLDEGDGCRIGQVAAEDDDVRLFAADRGPHVVEGRDDGGLDPLGFDERVEPNGWLDVLKREENLHVRGAWSVERGA